MGILFTQAGIFLAGLSVALGAFGAHALKSRISEDLQAVFEVGVRYQMYHALALILLGILTSRAANAWLQASGWSFAAGILVFSGSLYLLALSGVRTWGAVTPIGGLLLIAGWLFFAVGMMK